MKLQTIHPFPARMAPSIVWENLPSSDRCLKILDPMSGSGTTLVSARARGHSVIGCDTDPLALLIAQAWCTDINPEEINRRGALVLDRAIELSKRMKPDEAYPSKADEETRAFLKFWFDDECRVQLASLSKAINRLRNSNEKVLLWSAFSRLIITKKAGVSLAMDVSHSRPHRVYSIAPVKPFDKFLNSVAYIAKRLSFNNDFTGMPPAIIHRGDARYLPIESESIDMVITSPPYLNAIDYLRGHKLSLVWMGHLISDLRGLRASNIGSEVSSDMENSELKDVVAQMGDIELLDGRRKKMLTRYVKDMCLVMGEIRRVLKPGGRAVMVIGDSSISGVFIKNSNALISLGKKSALKLVSKKNRPLPDNRRYLPPPNAESSGAALRSRMKSEVILTFQAI